MRKTTKQEYRIFKREVEYWIDRLGLHCWDVIVRMGEIYQAPKGTIAQCDSDADAFFATISLCDHVPSGDLFCPKETAKHEVFHLLLSPLKDMAFKRFVTPDIICQEDERIVTTLSNCLN